MHLIYLSDKFYKVYNSVIYPQFLIKNNRPYAMIKITLNGLDFALPLRSNVRHNYVFWTDKAKNLGVDYSKAVLIPDSTFIDNTNPVMINSFEYAILKGNERIIITGFESFMNNYNKALKAQHVFRNECLCKFTTLKYYHKELNINLENKFYKI